MREKNEQKKNACISFKVHRKEKVKKSTCMSYLLICVHSRPFMAEAKSNDKLCLKAYVRMGVWCSQPMV